MFFVEDAKVWLLHTFSKNTSEQETMTKNIKSNFKMFYKNSVT